MRAPCALLTLASVLVGLVSLAGSEIQRLESELAIPDFSYAGYHRSEAPVPHVAGPLFNVTEFGAVPDDGKSDRDAIQEAIRAAETRGGGVIVFPAGRFDLNGVDGVEPIHVTGSRIIFRGSGAGEKGTVLYQGFPIPPPPPMRLWASPYAIEIVAPEPKATGVKITADVAQGERQIQVANTSGLRPGQWITLSLTDNNPELVQSELAGFQKIDPRWTSILEKGIEVYARHQIAAIEGNRIQLVTPVMKPIVARYQWHVVPFRPVEEVGVENIRFVGAWKDSFIHHRSWLDDGGYSMLKMVRVVNSWIRDCVFVDVSRAGTINDSAHVSVLNCRIEGTPGHDAIVFHGSSFCLMAGTDDLASQWHSVGVAKETMGNVLWRCSWPPTTCFESHSSQPRHTLFDSCTGGFMDGRGGGAAFNQPNHLEGLVLWNHRKTNPPVHDFQFEPLHELYWRVLQPSIVGMYGTPITFRAGQSKVVSLGAPIAEGSLYEHQVRRRLGRLPKDLVAIGAKGKDTPAAP